MQNGCNNKFGRKTNSETQFILKYYPQKNNQFSDRN